MKPHYQKMSPAFNLLWCPWRLDGIGVFKQARLILRGLPRDEAIKVAETQTSVLRKRMDGLRYIIPPGYLTHVVASFFGPLETNGGRVFQSSLTSKMGKLEPFKTNNRNFPASTLRDCVSCHSRCENSQPMQSLQIKFWRFLGGDPRWPKDERQCRSYPSGDEPASWVGFRIPIYIV